MSEEEDDRVDFSWDQAPGQPLPGASSTGDRAGESAGEESAEGIKREGAKPGRVGAKKNSGWKKPSKARSKLALWEPVIRSAYIIAVAVLVGLLAWRVNRPESTRGYDTGLDPVLLQPIKNVDVDTSSLRRAVESLNKVSPVKIELDADSFRHEKDLVAKADPERSPPVKLKLRGATVGQALAAVIATFDVGSLQLTFIVDNGWIIIGQSSQLIPRDKIITRDYEIDDLLDQWEPADHKPSGGLFGNGSQTASVAHSNRQDAADDLVRLLQMTLFQSIWDGINRPTNCQLFYGRLVITGPPQLHRDVQRLLFLLRHGQLVVKNSSSSSSPSSAASSTAPTTHHAEPRP